MHHLNIYAKEKSKESSFLYMSVFHSISHNKFKNSDFDDYMEEKPLRAGTVSIGIKL